MFTALERNARRFYISSLSTHGIYEVVDATMPHIRSDEPVYHEAKTKVRNLFKTWKNRTLACAEEWFRDWLDLPGNRKYSKQTDFVKLVKAVRRKSTLQDAKRVFHWAVESVEFEQCSPTGRAFIKCMTPSPLFGPVAYSSRRFCSDCCPVTSFSPLPPN